MTLLDCVYCVLALQNDDFALPNVVCERLFGVREWPDGKKELLYLPGKSIRRPETQTQARAWRSMIRWVCYMIPAFSMTPCLRHNHQGSVWRKSNSDSTGSLPANSSRWRTRSKRR